MKIYQVGGSVRDEIMNRPISDRDYVVVGSTPEEMLSLGYLQVGADFPIFIHPETGEEYALARQERKNENRGYNGFDVTFDVNTTLETDLFRRDLRINALAKNPETGEIIDPFNGQEDIKNKVLRHTSEAFSDDPVRVLRLARFSAKLGFDVADETVKLAKFLVNSGELNFLTSERIFKELEKTLELPNPRKFFEVLEQVGALKIIFPELHALIGIPAGPTQYHGEKDTFVHTMMVLDQASKHNNPLVNFGAIVHDLGKSLTLKEKLPSHPGHEEAGVPIVVALCDRLKAPTEYKRIGKLVTRHHGHVHKTFEMNAKSFVKIYNDFNRGHFEHDIDVLVKVAEADHYGRVSMDNHGDYPEAEAFRKVLTAVHKVKLSYHFTVEEIKEMNTDKIKQEFHKLKINAAKKALKGA